MKKENKQTVDVPIKGFKGYEKDLTCRGFQYEIGKTYETDKKPVRCTENGFHFCENPIDIFQYYSPASSRFTEVDGYGEVSRDVDGDSKVAVSKIKIGAEVSLHSIIESGIKFIFERTTLTADKNNTSDNKAASNSDNRGAASNSGNGGAASNSGYRGAASNSGNGGAASNSGNGGAASNSGNGGAASNSGYGGAASNSGYGGAASNSGDGGAAVSTGVYSTAETQVANSFACALGHDNKAKGEVGSWIILSEWDNGSIVGVKSVKIDGEKILPNTWYALKSGKIIVVD